MGRFAAGMNRRRAFRSGLMIAGAVCLSLCSLVAIQGDELELPVVAKPSAYPTFRLRGRIDTDFLWSDQTPENRAVFGDLPDTVGLRRARIGAEGHFSPDSRYVAEVDLASGEVVLRDVYLAHGNVQQSGEYKAGHMREPFSLEGGTSANSFAFLERSSINALDPARNWGVGFTRGGADERWTLSGGVFQAGTDPSDLEFEAGTTTAVTIRGTGLAWYEHEGKQLMHFGLAISERLPDQGVVLVRQRPSSPLLDLGDSSDSPFAPRLKIPANFQQLFNVQWAAVNGSLWTQAEWYGTLINQRDGGDVFLHGSHADVGYFLTGEQRSYLKDAGVFGPVSVHRPVFSKFSSKDQAEELGPGAWELTARLSYLNYDDGDMPTDTLGNPAGVILPQATAGVNWYLADRMRLMFNYVYSAPDEVSAGQSSASVFGLRLGMFW